MKKVIGTILNVISVLLTGIAFGLGSLTVMYQYEKTTDLSSNSNSVGNFYERVWLNGGHNSIYCVVLFFVLCAAALIITMAMFSNKKKGLVLNAFSALLTLCSGVGMLMFNKLFVLGTKVTTPYVLGEGAVAMGVILLIAGVFQVLKTVVTAKEE